MTVQVYGMTDKGMVREVNEDSFEVCGFTDGANCGFCVIADGMGGHNAGEVASNTAVSEICNELTPHISKSLRSRDAQVLLAGSIKAANSKVYSMSDLNDEQRGMGTTLIVVYVTGDTVYIANVGDSRAYLIRDKKITQLTVDHSVVEELVSNGSITRAQAASHPQKHVITRALGTEEDILVDVYEYKYNSGDIIIMCTDGLTEMVSDDDINSVCLESESIKEIAEKLVSMANSSGGIDNVTVVGLKF